MLDPSSLFRHLIVLIVLPLLLRLAFFVLVPLRKYRIDVCQQLRGVLLDAFVFPLERNIQLFTRLASPKTLGVGVGEWVTNRFAISQPLSTRLPQLHALHTPLRLLLTQQKQTPPAQIPQIRQLIILQLQALKNLQRRLVLRGLNEELGEIDA